MSLPSSRIGQPQHGVYGNHTASIDWCEENYTWSPYIAEFVNTISNGPGAVFAILGLLQAHRERLPARMSFCFGGILMISLGSALFHTTLTHVAQVLDEVPMILATSALVWCAFETDEGYHERILSPFTYVLVLFNALVAASCFAGLSPTLHEVGFGLLVTLGTARITYLLHFDKRLEGKNAQRAQAVGLFKRGIASFLTGFAIWNVDNLACDSYLRPWKARLGMPWELLLEGHSYWHILTGGLAAFYCITGSGFICLTLKEPEEDWYLQRRWGLPFVARGSLAKQAHEKAE